MTRERIARPVGEPSATVVRGRDHAAIGDHVVVSLGSQLAVGMSAGARSKLRTATDPNEDTGAIASGPYASLLIVADAHFGCEASEIVVDHVLETFGPERRPADLSDDELVALFFDAGVAVQRETSRAAFAHPDSRTTLALAVVTQDEIQWAALGDSCVLVASSDECHRLDSPRNTYLGQQFEISEIAAALTRGRCSRADVTGLVLTTDGLVDALAADGLDVTTVVATVLRECREAGQVAERLVVGALQRRAADALTVAVRLDD